MDLHYIRDRDGRELDFVVLKDRQPIFAVECKAQESRLVPSIKYFRERTSIPEFYQVHLGTKDIGKANTGGRSLPFWKFCLFKKMP